MDLVTESLTLMAGNSSSPLLVHLVEAVHAGGGLFGHALDLLEALGVPLRVALQRRLDGGEQHDLFLAAGLGERRIGPSRPSCRGAAAASRRRRRRGSCSAWPPSGHSKICGCTPSTPRATRPCRRTPACPSAAMAAAAWSCVEKMLHEAQRTSAPSAFSVSISTAVWIVMCSEPVMRAPLSGCVLAYSSRMAMRPGISVSAMAISLRPQSASAMSAITIVGARSGLHNSVHINLSS